MRRALAALVPLALVLPGCGGGDDGGLSRADYRARANAACAKTATAMAQLPRLQQEQKLSIDALQNRADEIGDALTAAITALKPPSDLQEEHAALLKEIGRQDGGTGDVAGIVKQEAALAAAFRAVGAQGCAGVVQASIDRLRSAPS